ncbi:sugar ABC transporter ATP-binding protein [Leucobacter sp. M11]|uniref:sugar ABC transporter ATP-binding protein n=1 Tax=Leucobacter sp. M11 TaxID=2993565 RepID=UPI002D8066A3|nr:sugar ABC transporter ATP-binding protein [Leucobacter sp. M11]MEB4615113.1 sugar ABC transporter ATP-binding protein [Leucobacter sp. M11]
MTDPYALEVREVTKTFPGVRALDRVNLRVRPGEVHALLGENGAGKSTLIKILTGIQPADQGELLINGQPQRFSSAQEATAAGIGVVHQERNVIADFTVAENIVLGNTPKKAGLVDWKAVRQGAMNVLDMLDFPIDPDTPTRLLSPAQTQLIEIARGLYSESQVLLLDEPTASISEAESELLFRVVHRLTEQGKSVLFVSHKLEEVFAHCDTVTIFRDGASVLESAPLADYTRDEIVDMLVGRTLARLDIPDRNPDRTGAPALELRRVDTQTGHQGINLAVHPGEVLGLYGLVGAGRSELARAILGLDRITSGQILVNGTATTIRSVGDALERHRIGYVTEDRKSEGLFLDQSVSRNLTVTVLRRLQNAFGFVPEQAQRDLADEYIQELDVRVSSRDQLVGQLSGGNQQKVSLGKWLAANTEILIIDEPTVGIDVRTKGAFYQLIWALATAGKAVIVISSDLAETVTLVDRIAVMSDLVITGEVTNTHDYDEMSKAVIRLVHRDQTVDVGTP